MANIKIKDIDAVQILETTAKIPISLDGVSAQTTTVKLIIDLAKNELLYKVTIY